MGWQQTSPLNLAVSGCEKEHKMLDLQSSSRSSTAILLAGFLASGLPLLVADAQSAPVVQSEPVGTPTRYQPNRFSKRAAEYYGIIWGVDSLSVRSVESGEIIRFAYRVINAEKAKPLNDKALEPALIDPTAGVKLVVPSLEKVGQLRQSGTPADGKAYWMAFSNKGRLVKRGDRVNVVIGPFRAENLIVE